MKETAIVKACLEYLGLRGIFAWRNNTAGIFNPKSGGYFFHGMKGVSDILGVLPDGRILCCEIKGPKGRLSEAQKVFQERIAENNGVACCVRSVDELAADLKEAMA